MASSAGGGAVETIARLGWLAAARMQIALVVFESLLAFWLLLGHALALAWLISDVTFSLFAGASLYLWYLGEATCACFGTVSFHPAYALSLDVAVVGLLSVLRPCSSPRTTAVVVLQLCRALVTVAILLVVIVGASQLWYPTPGDALAALRGELITVEPSALELPAGCNSEVKLATVTLRNHGDLAVRLIGASHDCLCDASIDLPITVPAGLERTISVRVVLPANSTGLFTRKAWILTDNSRQPRLIFRVAGLVRPTPDS